MQRKHPSPRRKRKAATSDIVGPASPIQQVPARWKHLFARLLALRDSLLRRQSDLSKDAEEEQPAFSMHMADAATDTFDRDFALGMLSSEQDAVYEIDQALDRIQNGTYGRCELTGNRIDAERLEAIPWTRFSAEAEKRLEREGGLKRARLGPREAVVREPAPQASAEES
jgi:DnaK suppressor protein